MKRQKEIIYIIVFIFLAVGFSAWSHKAYASGQSLRVSPVIMQISLEPGTIATHDATIENLTDAPLPLNATLNDFMTTGEEGGYNFTDSKENPLLSWIKLSDTDFLLGPKEKKKVRVTIHMPNTIPVGGYYSSLFFQPVIQAQNTQGAQISTKIGILMLANLGVPDPNAKKEEILTFTMPKLNTNGNEPFVLRVKNIALNYFTAKPILSVTPLLSWGQVPKKLYLEEKIIFPGLVRRWDDNKTLQNLKPNIYKARMVVSAGNGEDQTAEHYFIVFPFGQVFIWICGLLLIFFLIMKRKRFGPMLKALIRP